MPDQRRALVVEDTPSARMLVTALLTQQGFAVATAEDGEQGIDAARALDPELVILDVGLPGTDGFTACRAMREFSDAYVLMVTAQDSDLDKVIGDQFGANISKERTDLLDQGVAVWIVPDTTGAVAKLHKDKLYADLKVVKEGREVFVEESGDYGNAVSLSTVLSIPYVLDRLVPQLAAAVDGDPATKVEQPAS